MLTRLRAVLRSAGSEAGFTLVEMIIASVLGVLILTVGASILLSMFRTQHSVSDFADATTTGQLISRSVEEGVRNAAHGPSAAAGDTGIKASDFVAGVGQLLRARVAMGTQNGEVTWQCEAWYYSDATHTISYAHSDSGMIDDPGGFAWKDATHTGIHPVTAQSGVSWTMLGQNIDLGDMPVIFGSAAGQVNLNFKVSNGSADLVLIPNIIVERTITASGTGPDQCY